MTNLIDELSSFGVMTLSPIVTGTGLSEHKVIRSEKTGGLALRLQK